MQQDFRNKKRQRVKPAVIICIVIILTVTAGFIIWKNHLSKLNAEMENHLDGATLHLEQGDYDIALTEADEALTLAQKLRDNEATVRIENLTNLTTTILHGNDLFDTGNYQQALEAYQQAFEIAKSIDDLNTDRLRKVIATTEMYITFYGFMENADAFAKFDMYESALFIYEDARQIASALSFTEGVTLAESGIEEMQHRIIMEKHAEAVNQMHRGDQFFDDGYYVQAIVYFNRALDIFTEIDDQQGTTEVKAKITQAEQELLATEPLEPPPLEDTPGDIQDDTDESSEAMKNYQHNIEIDFDLKTLIDNQNRRPANQVRMGSREGMNEGWYNGCGWVAVYNALILLGNPKHPADIVMHFEENRGIVLGGVFGTYPNAIVDYMRSLGYDVNHTLFPQITKNLDDEIKNSRVAILAYAHTSAAHYITVEYNEDIDKFVVYNDSFARTRSETLGLGSITSAGAAIDSITALISSTRDILFSFSLIVIS